MTDLIWHTEKRKVNDLLPFKGNPRKADEKHSSDLRKSFEKFDLVEIPAINTDNTALAGNQRLKILQLLGRGEELIDVRVPSRALTAEEAKEYNLRSNKNTASWDLGLLANFDEGLLEEVGWEGWELDEIFSLSVEDDDSFDAESEAKKITEPKVKLGDLYEIDGHRILCGDSQNQEHIEKLMGGKVAKLVFTSPPYNMAGKMYKNYADNLKSEEYIKFNLDVLQNCKKFLKGFCFWNISYNKNARSEFIEIIYKIVKETGLQFIELIIWDKGHALPIVSKQGLTRRYEDVLLVGDNESIQSDLEIYFCGANDKKVFFNKKNQKGITNYWRVNTNQSQQKNHLACFPIALPIKGIELMTQRGDIVLDPFLGSGTTLIAAGRTGRKCFACELDPLYVELALNRFKYLFGKDAIKIC